MLQEGAAGTQGDHANRILRITSARMSYIAIIVEISVQIDHSLELVVAKGLDSVHEDVCTRTLGHRGLIVAEDEEEFDNFFLLLGGFRGIVVLDTLEEGDEEVGDAGASGEPLVVNHRFDERENGADENGGTDDVDELHKGVAGLGLEGPRRHIRHHGRSLPLREQDSSIMEQSPRFRLQEGQL